MFLKRFSERLKDYFAFTRKERNGIAVFAWLMILSQLALIYTHYMPDVSSPDDMVWLETELIALSDVQHHDSLQTELPSEIHYVSFDPNKATEAEWKQLGVNGKAVHSILNYLSKGGRFYKKEDVKKIYNLREDEYRRLERFISIHPRNQPAFSHKEQKQYHQQKAERTLVELNTASAEQLMSLPQIGEKRASQIIKYRNSLGGFYAKEQLTEVYSIPDSVFELIAPFVVIKDPVKKIHLNSVTLDSLYHPYIKRSLAKLIINYRIQHGAYKSLEDVKKLPLVTDSIFARLAPYITTDSE